MVDQLATPAALLSIAEDPSADVPERLHALGRAIDAATDLADEEALARADAAAEGLIALVPDSPMAAELAYFRANAWSALRHMRGSDAAWDWSGAEAQREILHLREAAYHPAFGQLDVVRQCQIETNLGNLLSHVGRFVDAVACWDRAIARLPGFAMALGNRGYGLRSYAIALYDRGHAGVMLLRAYDDLTAALAPEALHDSPDNAEAIEGFAEMRQQIARDIDVERMRALERDLHGSDNTSEQEGAYRRWCLHHRLFLNPLNDLGPLPVADRDVLMPPDIVVARDEPPSLLRFFNIMKQEYVSARWMLYEGSISDEVHCSDRGVLLYNTLDYQSHGLAVERVKGAFRSAYSLFDKIGQVVNHYWRPPISERVTIRKVWYEQTKAGDYVLRPEFVDQENWPLRGLFWLARDIFDRQPGFRDATDPDAKAIADVRNRLEHGFLAVHELEALFETLATGSPQNGPFGQDPNLYPISRRTLTAKTLRLLQLARAALIYLSLAIHREEQRRAEARGSSAGIVPLELGLVDDECKQ
jgi:tetratricopeptide (TPR) repeat protein